MEKTEGFYKACPGVSTAKTNQCNWELKKTRGLGLRFPLGTKIFKTKIMFQIKKKKKTSTLMKNFYNIKTTSRAFVENCSDKIYPHLSLRKKAYYVLAH